MPNLLYGSVQNLWVVCVLVGSFYTARLVSFLAMCITGLVVLQANTAKPQVFPHVISTFNRLSLLVIPITHRTNKSNNYLYKLITITNVEVL
jgi:hypothetical protein